MPDAVESDSFLKQPATQRTRQEQNAARHQIGHLQGLRVFMMYTHSVLCGCMQCPSLAQATATAQGLTDRSAS